MNIIIALVQLDIEFDRPDINLKRMEEFMGKAAEKGAQLVVFPEDAVTGPLGGQMKYLANGPGYLALFQALAIRYQIDVVPGSWAYSDGLKVYNATYYINKDGSIAGSYSKINLWETELVHLSPGPGVAVFPTAHGLVGLIICWDIAFPLLFAEMVALGAELIISPTYWSFSKPADDVGEVVSDEILLIDSLCTTRAFESNIIFAYCNAAGVLTDEGYDAVLSGRSQITHPHEKVVCKARGNREEMLVASVVLDRTKDGS